MWLGTIRVIRKLGLGDIVVVLFKHCYVIIHVCVIPFSTFHPPPVYLNIAFTLLAHPLSSKTVRSDRMRSHIRACAVAAQSYKSLGARDTVASPNSRSLSCSHPIHNCMPLLLELA
jgi:hypothetical protein